MRAEAILRKGAAMNLHLTTPIRPVISALAGTDWMSQVDLWFVGYHEE